MVNSYIIFTLASTLDDLWDNFSIYYDSQIGNVIAKSVSKLQRQTLLLKGLEIGRQFIGQLAFNRDGLGDVTFVLKHFRNDFFIL